MRKFRFYEGPPAFHRKSAADPGLKVVPTLRRVTIDHSKYPAQKLREIRARKGVGRPPGR